jgi:dihydroorotate dehydrogenase
VITWRLEIIKASERLLEVVGLSGSQSKKRAVRLKVKLYKQLREVVILLMTQEILNNGP